MKKVSCRVDVREKLINEVERRIEKGFELLKRVGGGVCVGVYKLGCGGWKRER